MKYSHESAIARYRSEILQANFSSKDPIIEEALNWK